MKFRIIRNSFVCTVAFSLSGIACQNQAADPAAASRNEAQQGASATFAVPVDFNPVDYRRSIERRFAHAAMAELGKDLGGNNESGFNPNSCFGTQSSQNATIQVGSANAGAAPRLEPSPGPISAPITTCVEGDAVYDDGDVYPDASGRVVLCRNGQPLPLAQNRYLRDVVLKAGATSDEVAGVEFYYAPFPRCNAFAQYRPNQSSLIVLYEGLVGGTSECPLRNQKDGLLAGVLLHELGHVKQYRSEDLSGMLATKNRSSKYCEDLAKIAVEKVKSMQTCGAVESVLTDAAGKCLRNIGYWSRRFEYDADNNVAVTMARNKDNLAFNPVAFSEVWQALGGVSDLYDTHPEPAGRAAALQKAYKQLGLRAVADDSRWTNALLPIGGL